MRALRRISTIGGVGLLLGLSSVSARAANHHTGAGLVCSDCHVIHYTPQHSQPGGLTPGLGAGGPYPKLLKNSATELCLSCHDGQVGSGGIAPDVMQLAGAGQPTHRSAGAFQEQAGVQAENGHSLGVSAVPPGGSRAITLDCLSCHDPHGNNYFRNLVPNPGGTSGLGITAFSEAQASPTSARFSVGNVRYTASEAGISAWCGGCHGDFHGTGGSAGMGGSTMGDTNQSAISPWLLHPTRDVTMAQAVANRHVDPSRWFSALASRLPVVSATGLIPGSGAGSDNQVFCGTCHRAHGSSRRYGLIWDDPATAEPEDGTAQMESCQQCHFK